MIGSERLRFVRSLIQVMERGEIDDLEVGNGNFSVSLSTRAQSNGVVAKQQQVHLTPPTNSISEAANSEDLTSREVIGLAPCIGLFQSSPTPEAEPYIKVGQTVKAGQVVVGIFALQLTHEFTIARDGVIKEILVNDGDKVDFGRELLVLELSPEAEPLKEGESLIGQIINKQ